MTICENKEYLNTQCQFCDNAADIISEVYVCNRCNTVCFTKSILPDERKRLISEYLDSVQSKVLKQQTHLHDLEQKYISGAILTSIEQEIRERISDFQDIRLELGARIANGSQLSSKNERNLLYRLLILSEWLSNYLEEGTNHV